MNNFARRIALLSALLYSSIPAAFAFNCVEVLLFEVDRNNFTTKEYERAAATPQEFLEAFQHATVGEIVRSQNGLTAVKAVESSCPDDNGSLEFGGTVTDFKAGNQALRYFVGFGAGAQKLAVDAWLRNKTTGEIVSQGKIVDRKWAGFGGGDDRKGVRDFAEKVVAFLNKGLHIPRR